MYKLIYLDTNVIIDGLKKDRINYSKICTKLNSLRKKFNFPYSPAHIEELANILRDEKDIEKSNNYIQEQVLFISELSENIGIYPSYQEIVIRNENPKICLTHVLDNYDSTIFAEMLEEFNQAFRDKKSYIEFFSNIDNLIRLKKLLLGNYDNHQELIFSELDNKISLFIENNKKLNNNPDVSFQVFVDFQKKYNINKHILGELQPSEVFSDNSIINFIAAEYKKVNLSIKYDDIISSHHAIEGLITELLLILELVGYKTEGRGKYRSRMHDNTHAIYATKADYFVIGDKKYRQKVQAVYSHLKVPTQVLSVEEFIEYDFTNNG